MCRTKYCFTKEIYFWHDEAISSQGIKNRLWLHKSLIKGTFQGPVTSVEVVCQTNNCGSGHGQAIVSWGWRHNSGEFRWLITMTSCMMEWKLSCNIEITFQPRKSRVVKHSIGTMNIVESSEMSYIIWELFFWCPKFCFWILQICWLAEGKPMRKIMMYWEYI